LLNFLELYLSVDNKRSWHFVAPADSVEPFVISQVLPPDSLIDASIGTGSEGSSSLPDFMPVSKAAFAWGLVGSQSFCHALNVTY